MPVTQSFWVPDNCDAIETMPIQLHCIVHDMAFLLLCCSEGKLKQLCDFEQGITSGWVSWSYNVMVKKPLSWSFSTLVKRPVSWGIGQLTGQTHDEAELGDLVVLDLVKVSTSF